VAPKCFHLKSFEVFSFLFVRHSLHFLRHFPPHGEQWLAGSEPSISRLVAECFTTLPPPFASVKDYWNVRLGLKCPIVKKYWAFRQKCNALNKLKFWFSYESCGKPDLNRHIINFATTLNITTFSIMTLSIKAYLALFRINDTRHKWYSA
jgi:hypothetical protein